MATILRFDTVLEQIENLDYYGKYEDILFSNREDKTISYTKDSTEGKEFYCENENGNKLYKTDNPWFMNELNIMSNEIKSIGLYDTETNERVKTAKTFDPINDTPLYKVGLMSDVHYNDTDGSDEDPDTMSGDDGSEYSEDLKNAMTFFEANGVDFVSCSGDISSDYSEHILNYKYCLDKYAPNISAFTCCGNHDTKPKFKYRDRWLQAMALDRNNEYEIHRFDDGEDYSKDLGDGTYDNYATDDEGTSFYFKKYWGENENDFDVYIYLNLEYGHNHRDYYYTHDPRKLRQDELLVHSEVGPDDYHMYCPSTLRYFADLLEEFKDNRCFIFTHIMFKDMAGTYHKTNLYNYYNYHVDVMRGDQGEFCEQLLNRYSNNYWFSGHSHYKWMWQKYDKYINVKATENGSYTIHIPSLARPLKVSSGYSVAGKDSEAGIMDVYRDYVVINGYVLKEETNNSLDNYINTIENYDGELKYFEANWFDTMGSQYAEIEALPDNYISITLKENPADIYYDFRGREYPKADSYKSLLPVVRFEDVQVTNEAGEDITQDVMDERKIGFLDNFDGDYYYYLLSNHYYTLNSTGLKFKMSSGSGYVGQTITVKFKAKYALIKTAYQNQKYPLATYKL